VRTVRNILVAGLLVLSGSASAQTGSSTDAAHFAEAICRSIPEGELTRSSITEQVQVNSELLSHLIGPQTPANRFDSQTVSKRLPLQQLPERLATVDACEEDLTNIILAGTKTDNSKPGAEIKHNGEEVADGTRDLVPDGTSGLIPVREYLKSSDIPPHDVGAYGVVAFQSKATPANRNKLTMVCNAFVAFFPRSETSRALPSDQMMTIWPIDNPDAAEANRDDCNYAVDHYDLNAAEAAIKDAQRQHAMLSGEGPYLIGWSPSNSRGVPGKLVLVVDMSDSNNQTSVDHQFLFWKQKIIEDPTLWRKGFSLERVRMAIRDFANEYGQDLLTSIKLIGTK
jgi:hypothetical protein